MDIWYSILHYNIMWYQQSIGIPISMECRGRRRHCRGRGGVAILQLPESQTKQEIFISAGWRSAAMHALPDTEDTTVENRTHGTQNSVQCLWGALQIWKTTARV
jgi:hypothetical protein